MRRCGGIRSVTRNAPGGHDEGFGSDLLVRFDDVGDDLAHRVLSSRILVLFPEAGLEVNAQFLGRRDRSDRYSVRCGYVGVLTVEVRGDVEASGLRGGEGLRDGEEAGGEGADADLLEVLAGHDGFRSGGDLDGYSFPVPTMSSCRDRFWGALLAWGCRWLQRRKRGVWRGRWSPLYRRQPQGMSGRGRGL